MKMWQFFGDFTDASVPTNVCHHAFSGLPWDFGAKTISLLVHCVGTFQKVPKQPPAHSWLDFLGTEVSSCVIT
jgi:hypothetical protein